MSPTKHTTKATPATVSVEIDHGNHRPITPATLALLAERLGLTEEEGQALLAAAPIDENLQQAILKVNLHGIAVAYSEPVVAQLVKDQAQNRFEEGTLPADLAGIADKVAVLSSATEKLEHLALDGRGAA